MIEQIKKHDSLIRETLTKERIWDLSNKVLYDMCRNHPLHTDSQVIIMKTSIIGRVYGVQLVRFKKNKKDNRSGDKFYEEKVIPTFKNSGIDEKISNLKTKNLSPENFHEILSVHKFLMETLRHIIHQDDHSFCSKYLHFHLPKLYFLYDTRGCQSVSILGDKLNKEQKQDFFERPDDYDLVYVKYFLKCYYLKKELEEYLNRKLKIENLIIYSWNYLIV